MTAWMRDLVRLGTGDDDLPPGFRREKVPVTVTLGVDAAVSTQEQDLPVLHLRQTSDRRPDPLDNLLYTFGCAPLGRDVAFVTERVGLFRAMMQDLAAAGVTTASAFVCWARPLVVALGRGATPEHLDALLRWGCGVAPEALDDLVGSLDAKKTKAAKLLARGNLHPDDAQVAAWYRALQVTVAAFSSEAELRHGEALAAAVREAGEPWILPVDPKGRVALSTPGEPRWWTARRTLDRLCPPTTAAVLGQCSLCGETDVPLARLLGKVKGSQPFAFNEDAYWSYGRTQAYNTSICERCGDRLIRGLDLVTTSQSVRLPGETDYTTNLWWRPGVSLEEPGGALWRGLPEALAMPSRHQNWWERLRCAGETDEGEVFRVQARIPAQGRWVFLGADLVPVRQLLAGARRWADTFPWGQDEAVVGGVLSPWRIGTACLPWGGPGSDRDLSGSARALVSRVSETLWTWVLEGGPFPEFIGRAVLDRLTLEGLGAPKLPKKKRGWWFARPVRLAALRAWLRDFFPALADSSESLREAAAGECVEPPETTVDDLVDITTLDPSSRFAYRSGQYLSGLCALEFVVGTLRGRRVQRGPEERFLAVLQRDPLHALADMHERVVQLSRSAPGEAGAGARREALADLWCEIAADLSLLPAGPLTDRQRVVLFTGIEHDRRIRRRRAAERRERAQQKSNPPIGHDVPVTTTGA